MSIEEQIDALALPATDDISDADQKEVMAGNLVDLLRAVEDGTLHWKWVGPDRDALGPLCEGDRGDERDRLHREDESTFPAPYRATFLLKNGRWTDLEGSVIVARAFLFQGRLAAGERAAIVYGEPLLRVRARSLPADATEHDAMSWLRKFHVVTHHATPTEMAQAIRDAGGSKMLIRLAQRSKCVVCDIDSMPKSHAKSTLPLAARSFNSVAIIDVMDVALVRLESPPIKIQILVAVDAFTSYGFGWIIDSVTSRGLLSSLVKGWFSVFGSPRRVYSDGAKPLVSEGWHDTMVRWGVVATSSGALAAQAPWQHGKVAVYIRRVRRFIRAVWRTLAPYAPGVREPDLRRAQRDGPDHGGRHPEPGCARLPTRQILRRGVG